MKDLKELKKLLRFHTAQNEMWVKVFNNAARVGLQEHYVGETKYVGALVMEDRRGVEIYCDYCQLMAEWHNKRMHELTNEIYKLENSKRVGLAKLREHIK
jgi:hypothetical protein